MNSWVSFFVVLFTTVSSFAQSECYSEAARAPRTGRADYTVTFNKEITLDKNKSGNYSKRFTAGRVFGCIIFSVVPTLSGEFKSTSGTYLTAKCEDKKDYAFMQFVNAEGRRTFRIQCERLAYEEDESEKFVPGSTDTADLLKGIVTVK
jgi:chorismate synthase